ncbi:MAG: hypothetical protein AAFX85_17935, partial [Pseudomonadota bacterium]
MKAKLLTTLGGCLALGASQLALANWGLGDVDIDVVTPNGRSLPVYQDVDSYRVRNGADHAERGWVEATPGTPYALRVRNLTPRRVGVVIAVDGRNIINGRRSNLERDEAMYVLGPYESAVYRGWRTGRNRVNEFYFTDAERSYAGAFDDYSAMGLISAAVYREAVPKHKRRYGVESAP